MAVERTKHGTWRARWREPDGRHRSRSFPRKIDADRFLAAMRGDLARGTYAAVTGDRVKVSAWADEWLAGATNLAEGTRATYRRDLDRHILPALGDLELRKVTATHVDELLAGQLAAGTASSSVVRHYRTIHRMFAVAVAKGRLARNPCTAVTVPRLVEIEMRFLTAVEVEALATAISPRYRVWVLVAAYGGLRWSELAGLRRRDVAGVTLTVRQQLLRVDGEWRREVVKTAAGRRRVTLPASVAVELAAHLAKWSQPGPDGLVFPNRRGAPIGSSMRANVFGPAVKRAGIAGRVRPHDLRHTAVALAIDAGAHPKTIQIRMGHKSITVTLDRYGHLFPGADEDVAAGLDDARRAALEPEDEAEPKGEGEEAA